MQATFAVLTNLNEIRLYEYNEASLSEPLLTLENGELPVTANRNSQTVIHRRNKF